MTAPHVRSGAATLAAALAIALHAVGCGDDGSGGAGGSAGIPDPPAVTCEPPLDPVDVATPDHVIGSGSADSCDEARLRAAVEAGGTIVFDCGAAPLTIPLSAPLVATRDVVIDGGGTVTLSGEGRTRILELRSSFEQEGPTLTVQRLTFRDGRSTGDDDTEAGGGAIYRVGGRLVVIDSAFANNRGPERGQDVAGGAIYALGGSETLVVGSTFVANTASNGGAIGTLGASLALVNSTLTDNAATGEGGNPGDGGNGGAVYYDGRSTDLTICGSTFAGNMANAFGGALFRVDNTPDDADGRGPTRIDRSSVIDNEVTPGEPSAAGGLYLQGVAAVIEASTIARNAADTAGGVFWGPKTDVTLINVTIAENVARDSLGGGMFVTSEVRGRVTNTTFARNESPDDDSFAAAIAGGTEALALRNVLIADHVAGNAFNPISCSAQLADEGGNVQFPVDRGVGGSDDPGALCVMAPTIIDPELGPLEPGSADAGATEVAVPAAAALAGLGADCPATDQRGRARPAACTPGAVELGP